MLAAVITQDTDRESVEADTESTPIAPPCIWSVQLEAERSDAKPC